MTQEEFAAELEAATAALPEAEYIPMLRTCRRDAKKGFDIYGNRKYLSERAKLSRLRAAGASLAVLSVADRLKRSKERINQILKQDADRLPLVWW